tara:strand:+ start:482 stop:1387 length:906 start_codon:yes stop_codon:yes gene_type:complete
MKKLLIVLFCLAIFNAGCRQKTERYNMNEVGHKNGINYVKSTMEPVNGIVYGEDENGQLMLEANFKDGRYHGFARTWHENGELHTESSWKDEKEDGVFSIWYENGQKEMEENYVDGKLMSQKFWDKNGIERRASFDELTSVETGNGSVMAKKYKNGYQIFTGIAFDVFNNGQLKRENSYKDGKPNGLCREWNEDGQLLLLGYKKDGKFEGLQEIWNENGQLELETNYKNGVYHGLLKWWHENGQLKMEANYIEGKLADGVSKTWYDNGQLMLMSNYKNGNPVSITCWDINGSETDCNNLTP